MLLFFLCAITLLKTLINGGTLQTNLCSLLIILLIIIIMFFICTHILYKRKLHTSPSSLCRIVCKTNLEAVSSFEQALFPIFQGILQQDIPGE